MQKDALPENQFVPVQINTIRKQFAKGIGENVLALKNGRNNDCNLPIFQIKR